MFGEEGFWNVLSWWFVEVVDKIWRFYRLWYLKLVYECIYLFRISGWLLSISGIVVMVLWWYVFIWFVFM